MTSDPEANHPLEIRPFHADDTHDVIALWQRSRLTRPWNDPHKDIARKMHVQPHLFVVGVLSGAIVASVMAGYDGHRGWINYLAVDAPFRRRGYARALMTHVENALRAIGCPKLNMQVRASNAEVLAFYYHLGYVQDEALSLGKRLIADE
jgi:ribosomal protein S18 acetylase RimI-like enzyme